MKKFRSSKALLIDADDNVLVLWRSESHPRYAHYPDLAGGMIEDDESHKKGVAREILEETKVVISSKDLVLADMYTHSYHMVFVKMERSLYAVRLKTRPEISISWEHDRYDWVPLKKVKGLEKSVQKQLDRAIKKGFFETF
ncbi:MAG: NUDIX domain-containing protein [Candidatus Saccharimonadales bacterium]